jgi:hypothetical protein
MSKRALSSLIIQEGMKSILMGPGMLYASLRNQAVL